MTLSKKTTRRWPALLAVALLAACGGGGGGGDDEPPTLQGVWDTTITPGGDVGGVVVLEDGAFWGFSGPGESIDTLFQGTVTLSGNALASNNLRVFDLGGGFADATSVAGTLASNAFNLSASVNGAVSAVAGTRSPSDASYDYNRPAQLGDIVGSWTGAFSTGDTGTVTVQANGTFASTTALGCSFTGTAAPRGSGKNVFNITVSFGAAPCALPNTTGTGIAIASRATSTEPAVLVVMAVTSNRDAAALYLALKP